MKLSVLASGSTGNGYVLYNDTTAIVLEAGVHIKELYKAYGYGVERIAACLVTHEHKDHCGFVGDYLKAGIPVYASAGTIEGMELPDTHNVHALEPLKAARIGEWSVTPFPTQHDCKEPFGFVLSHPDCGNVLFATDTYFLKYRFTNLNNIMIECNYVPEKLDENVESGKLPFIVKRRTLKSHMSLPRCLATLQEHDLRKVVNIVLVHMSAGNGDAEKMTESIALGTGKRVFIAEAGLTIDFNQDFCL